MYQGSESDVTQQVDLMLVAEFEARRRRVLRATGVFFLASVGSLALALVAHAFAPEWYEASVKVFVTAFAVSGLGLGLTLRRHWRCPACHARWIFNEVLASGNWNHCATCGTPLRTTPLQTERERLSVSQFAQDDTPEEALLARFLRRRRHGMLAAVAVVIAGIATLVWAHDQAWSKAAEQAVLALVGGIVLTIGLACARCPRRLGCRSTRSALQRARSSRRAYQSRARGRAPIRASHEPLRGLQTTECPPLHSPAGE